MCVGGESGGSNCRAGLVWREKTWLAAAKSATYRDADVALQALLELAHAEDTLDVCHHAPEALERPARREAERELRVRDTRRDVVVRCGVSAAAKRARELGALRKKRDDEGD